jgi:hypothetical protein
LSVLLRPPVDEAVKSTRSCERAPAASVGPSTDTVTPETLEAEAA